MTVTEMQNLFNQLEYKGFNFTVNCMGERPYLQLKWDSACVITGAFYKNTSRKWFLSEHMTKSELVQTAFKACLTAEEHEARENFKYKGEPIYGPHFNVDALHGLCRDHHLDIRESVPNG